MPCCQTKYFGTVSYEEASVLHFPAGLPGFESERQFLSLEQPAHQPLVFLQSLATPELCFVALPAKAIEPSYELDAEESDLGLLEVHGSRAGLLRAMTGFGGPAGRASSRWLFVARDRSARKSSREVFRTSFGSMPRPTRRLVAALRLDAVVDRRA